MTSNTEEREGLLEKLQNNTEAHDVNREQIGYIVMNKSQFEAFKEKARGERRDIVGDILLPCIFIEHQGNYIKRELEELDALIAIGYTLHSSIGDS